MEGLDFLWFSSAAKTAGLNMLIVLQLLISLVEISSRFCVEKLAAHVASTVLGFGIRNCVEVSLSCTAAPPLH